MFDRLTARLSALRTRLRRIERREVGEFRRWAENTDNLIHLSVVVFVPLVIGLVTLLANAVAELSFLLFPPLASGTFTLFADPEGRYASAKKFVVGLTFGALCGWAALAATTAVHGGPTGRFGVSPESAALAVFLTGAVTWLLDVEEPAAFSTALLVLVTDQARPVDYVGSVLMSSLLVAGAFLLWRTRVYERRAEYLYETTQGDDHVLVPMRGETSRAVATFGARLAAAHEAGKVVLLAVLDEVVDEDERTAEAESTVEELEAHAQRIRTRVGVPCEVVVASGDPLPTTFETARNANCDLVVTPYEEESGLLSEYVRGVFGGPHDAVALRTTPETERWRRVLVPVARPGDSAHAMVDFASRLAGRGGTVSLCTCIGNEVERRRAETMLANLAETPDVDVETRVARSGVLEFIEANAPGYDLVVIGASRDRSKASRFVSPPTFERLRGVEADVAVVDRGRV
jgi:nucleotide-binding universal stress UspA family protein